MTDKKRPVLRLVVEMRLLEAKALFEPERTWAIEAVVIPESEAAAFDFNDLAAHVLNRGVAMAVAERGGSDDA